MLKNIMTVGNIELNDHVIAQFHVACGDGDLEVMDALLAEHGAKNLVGATIPDEDVDFNCTPLHRAVRELQYDATKKLIDAGADVNSLSGGTAPLHELVSAALHDRLDDSTLNRRELAHHALSFVSLLERAGADLDVRKERGGYTPLGLISLDADHGALNNGLFEFKSNFSGVKERGDIDWQDYSVDRDNSAALILFDGLVKLGANPRLEGSNVGFYGSPEKRLAVGLREKTAGYYKQVRGGQALPSDDIAALLEERDAAKSQLEKLNARIEKTSVEGNSR